jgi:hypothetical protein
MSRSTSAAPVLFLALPLLVLAGCGTIRRQEAKSTGQLLAAAGFQIRPADASERLADLSTTSPNKLVARTTDGKVVYTFADPNNCHCLYVGGPNEYSEYQRLKVKKEIAEDAEAISMKWTLWEPWWF